MSSPSCCVQVTGGPGFLGSHLCEHLAELGHDVLCVANFYTGSKENIARAAVGVAAASRAGATSTRFRRVPTR